MGSTTVSLGGKGVTFAAVELPQLRDDPVVTAESVTFVQTYGGRTALPAPRHVPRPPFVQFRAPLVWTTLKLTINADGSSDYELTGASTFPRHWVYDQAGKLAAKVGLADFKQWYRKSFGRNTPWGSTNSTALVTAVETALERELAGLIMRGGEPPTLRKLKPDALLTEQGQPGDEVFLVLDGVLAVEVDGQPLAELGPGAILGERGGARRRRSARRRCARSRSAGSRSRAAISSTAPRSSRSARVTGARSRREDRTREAALLRGSRLDVGTRCGVRSRRRAHVVRRARARRRTVDVGARRGHRDPARHRPSRGRAFAGTVLLTHLHWDHVQGLPFFAAGDRDDAHVRVLHARSDRARRSRPRRRPTCSSLAMSPPHFPIGPDGLRGDWSFESAEAGESSASRASTSSRSTFRTRAGARTGTASPTAARRSRTSPTTARSPTTTPAIARECAGVDLLVHDAQFLEHERAVADLYGHATVDDALDARRAVRGPPPGAVPPLARPAATTTSTPSARAAIETGAGRAASR